MSGRTSLSGAASELSAQLSFSICRRRKIPAVTLHGKSISCSLCPSLIRLREAAFLRRVNNDSDILYSSTMDE